jgi:hypothetical protein
MDVFVKAPAVEALHDLPATVFELEEENMAAEAGGEIICRIKLLRPELPDDLRSDTTTPLHCAVNVKERVVINGKSPRIKFVNKN